MISYFLISDRSMVSIIAATTLILAPGLVSINTFEELPPLPDYIPLPLSSPVIPLVIEIPNDLEVDKLISEVTKVTVLVSKTPLQVFSVRAACPLCSQWVKTPCHIISKSSSTSPVPPSAPPDSSNGLIVLSVSLARDLLQLYGLHSGHLYLNLVPASFVVPSMKDLVSLFF